MLEEKADEFESSFFNNIQKDNLWNILYEFINILFENEDIIYVLDDFQNIKDEFLISNMLSLEKLPNPNLVIVPSFLAKGLEFDSVIIYNEKNNYYLDSEKYLYYVAVTRSMHELIVYNN